MMLLWYKSYLSLALGRDISHRNPGEWSLEDRKTLCFLASLSVACLWPVLKDWQVKWITLINWLQSNVLQGNLGSWHSLRCHSTCITLPNIITDQVMCSGHTWAVCVVWWGLLSCHQIELLPHCSACQVASTICNITKWFIILGSIWDLW